VRAFIVGGYERLGNKAGDLSSQVSSSDILVSKLVLVLVFSFSFSFCRKQYLYMKDTIQFSVCIAHNP